MPTTEHTGGLQRPVEQGFAVVSQTREQKERAEKLLALAIAEARYDQWLRFVEASIPVCMDAIEKNPKTNPNYNMVISCAAFNLADALLLELDTRKPPAKKETKS